MDLNSYYFDHPCQICRKPIMKLQAIGVHVERDPDTQKITGAGPSHLTKDQMDTLQDLEYPTCGCLNG